MEAGGGGHSQGGGLALRDALQNAVVLIAREMALFRFEQQVSEVLPELYYSVACQGWQSLQVFRVLLREAASLSFCSAAAKRRWGNRRRRRAGGSEHLPHRCREADSF